MRRSGHEIRNALSGIAVNVEVVRTRIGREGTKGEVAEFADRAAREVTSATDLANAALAIADAVLVAAAKDGIRSLTPDSPRKDAARRSGAGGATGIEVMIYGDRARGLAATVKQLVDAIGVTVEERDQSVIFRVLPEDKSHSQN